MITSQEPHLSANLQGRIVSEVPGRHKARARGTRHTLTGKVPSDRSMAHPDGYHIRENPNASASGAAMTGILELWNLLREVLERSAAHRVPDESAKTRLNNQGWHRVSAWADSAPADPVRTWPKRRRFTSSGGFRSLDQSSVDQ